MINTAYSVIADTRWMNRDDWLRTRKQGIGGSEAAAILGLNPFSSALAVWADKTTADVNTDDGNENMWLGTVLEDHVARRYAKQSGLNIVRCNQMMKSNDYPCMIANIDRRVKGQKVGIEIKTTNMLNRTDFDGGEISPWYYCQCVHYMAVTGWDKWILVIYVIGRGLYDFVIERNEDEIAALKKAEVDFWTDHVLAGKPPLADGSESAGNVLLSRFPASNGATIALTCDDAVEQYVSLDQQIKALQKERDAQQQRIMEAMQENERGEAARYIVTWKSAAPRRTLDTKRLAEELPDVYDQYVKIGAPSRRFTIKAKK